MPDNIGFSNSSHGHCRAVDSTESGFIRAWVERVLLDRSVETKAWRVSRAAFSGRNLTVDETKWIDWAVPTLD